MNDAVASTHPTRIALLRGYLIVTGLVLLTAAPCALLPYSAMDAVHQSLGLGTLPDGPMTLYLARSASALYASIGPVYLFLARDPMAHAALLRLLGTTKIVLGVLPRRDRRLGRAAVVLDGVGRAVRGSVGRRIAAARRSTKPRTIAKNRFRIDERRGSFPPNRFLRTASTCPAGIKPRRSSRP